MVVADAEQALAVGDKIGPLTFAIASSMSDVEPTGFTSSALASAALALSVVASPACVGAAFAAPPRPGAATMRFCVDPGCRYSRPAAFVSVSSETGFVVRATTATCGASPAWGIKPITTCSSSSQGKPPQSRVTSLLAQSPSGPMMGTVPAAPRSTLENK